MKKSLFLIIMCTAMASCTRHNEAKPVLIPAKASLTFPLKDAACTQGTVLSSTTSSVTFTWNNAANANSYELHLFNLLTSDSTEQTTSKTQLPVTLNINTPYSWYVVSRSSQSTSTAKSDIWKFYMSGPGVTSYAPFPADIISPIQGQDITAANGTIMLSWQGSDLDNDIISYNVYFGSTSTPPIYKNSTTASSVNVTVLTGNTYFWKVTTTDSKGNTSDSGTYQFKVN